MLVLDDGLNRTGRSYGRLPHKPRLTEALVWQNHVSVP